MHISDFGELSLGRAKNILTTLNSVEPALEDLKEEVESQENIEKPKTRTTGDIGLYVNANSEDYSISEIPCTEDINTVLGFLDYNEILEVQGHTVANESNNRHEDFYPETYDQDLMEESIQYLKEKLHEHIISEHERIGHSSAEEVRWYKMYNFDEFNSV